MAIGAIADTMICDRYCPKKVSNRSIPFYERQHNVARAVPIRIPGTEFQQVIVDIASQPDLDDVRGVVTDRVLPILERGFV